ncbi:hypothetical protein B7494_g8285 [Chlorociboria aeruginascens]|nr:hypothetical protein B7494_g8285 [Chlorociboria aeruginascens]
MEFSIHKLQDGKLAVHIAQAVLILVAWILEIVVFRSSATIDGRTGWYFGLCFLTVPAIIYLTMTPRFPRTRKFANPYVLAFVDLFYAILWISAFASVASYNSAGKLLFVLTTAMSVYGLIYYRREGYLPGASRAPHNAQMIDPDKDAFSTAPHDDEYAPVHNTDDHEFNEIHEPEGYDGGPSNAEPRYDSPSYGGGSAYQSPQVHDEISTAYTGYTPAATPQSGGRAQFPAGSYDNV